MDSSKLKRVAIVAKEFSRQRFCWLESLKYEDAEGTLPILICNNFFDIALINWAHLFGNNKDDLHFRNVLSNPDNFKSAIMHRLSMTDADWDSHWKSLKDFRDSRVAHIDPIDSVIVPDLNIAFECISKYYEIAITELKAQDPHFFGDDTLQGFVEDNAEYYTRDISKVFNALKT